MKHLVNRVYGVVLNDVNSLEKLKPELTQAPYKKPAVAPVLYIKPQNTLNTEGCVFLPNKVASVEVGTTLGLVIGQDASRLTKDNALDALAGLVIAADLSIPHDSYYRPAIREKCFDGSLLLSEVYSVQDISKLSLTTRINGKEINHFSMSELKRTAVELLVDITEFMTLNKGDVLLLGVPYQAPLISAGQVADIICEGLGSFSFATAAETTKPLYKTTEFHMNAERLGRIQIAGQIHQVVPAETAGKIQTADGRIFSEDSVHWLPPIEAGTVFALGLNYADHAKELAFKAPEVPLVFLKGKNTLIGHNQNTYRPVDADYMHYECELVVVIGKTAHHVKAEEAPGYILGYTVANDYAIRDYLENFYRPNLRVKNRDGCTPLGPWLTVADKVPDPMSLGLTTKINGKVVQQGTTKDMIFSIGHLIEYLSSLMTLEPGDIILTGTPEGLADVRPGDVVETEVEGLGILRNTLITKDL